MTYKLKQAVRIEALQFLDTAERLSELSQFVGDTISVDYSFLLPEPTLKVRFNGDYCKTTPIKHGDWLAKGTDGCLYHVTKEKFEELYEPVVEEEPKNFTL